VRENEARAYKALHALNTRPSVGYLARVVREPASRIEAPPHVASASRGQEETA
jgi:hypothetical protein